MVGGKIRGQFSTSASSRYTSAAGAAIVMSCATSRAVFKAIFISFSERALGVRVSACLGIAYAISSTGRSFLRAPRFLW